MRTALPVLAASLLLASCASHQKKILVYASSDIQVDNSQKNIALTEGTTHHEKELDFTGNDPVTLHVQSPAGQYDLVVAGDGLFIANLKNDTVVGSYQRVGVDTGEARISQEQLTRQIDSLRQLVLGKNLSPSNRNYFIPPGKIARITGAVNAKVFGPYTRIPGSFDAGSVPEIYKFYTNSEEREIITKLSSMSQ